MLLKCTILYVRANFPGLSCIEPTQDYISRGKFCLQKPLCLDVLLQGTFPTEKMDNGLTGLDTWQVNEQFMCTLNVLEWFSLMTEYLELRELCSLIRCEACKAEALKFGPRLRGLCVKT